MATQLEILQEIQDGGHNVVTCGMCGHILLVRADEEEHQCVVCYTASEPCDFPDFISSTDTTGDVGIHRSNCFYSSSITIRRD